jgi:hypothetical protein
MTWDPKRRLLRARGWRLQYVESMNIVSVKEAMLIIFT